MSNESAEQASVAREERVLEILGGLKGWPLDKRETLVAFNMMGLTSRLQPLQVESAEHQKLVVTLAIKLAELTIMEGERSQSALAQAWEEGKYQGEGEAVGGLSRSPNPYKL
jgi:hypothetical protein